MRTRKVPEEQVDRIQELAGRYREFRHHRRELASIQKELLETLSKLESTVNEQTRKPLSYLAITPNIATQTRTTARKPRQKKKQNGEQASSVNPSSPESRRLNFSRP